MNNNNIYTKTNMKYTWIKTNKLSEFKSNDYWFEITINGSSFKLEEYVYI